MYIDLFCLLFLIYGLVSGYFKGFIRSVLGIAALFFGILIALKLGPLLEDFLARTFNLGPMLSLVLGVLLCFLLIYWGIRLLASTLDKRLKKTGLNIVNRIFGALVLAGFMVVVYGGILWFFNQAYFVSDRQKAESKTYPYLAEIPAKTRAVFAGLQPYFKGFNEKLENIREKYESED